MPEHECKDNPQPEPRASAAMTRRDFHRLAAHAAAGIFLAASLEARGAAAAEAAEASTDEAVESANEASATAAEEAPEGLREALARVRAAAPGLPPEDLPELESQVKSALQLGQALRKHGTPDGSEPGSVFSALLPARKARP